LEAKKHECGGGNTEAMGPRPVKAFGSGMHRVASGGIKDVLGLTGGGAERNCKKGDPRSALTGKKIA